MAVSRMNNRKISSITKTNEVYKKMLQNRGINSAHIYETPVYSLDDTQKDLKFEFKEETWKEGDRLYKISQKFYNSVEYWWVIAMFNQKPTDSHFLVGDVVLIPYPLEEALEFIGVL